MVIFKFNLTASLQFYKQNLNCHKSDSLSIAFLFREAGFGLFLSLLFRFMIECDQLFFHSALSYSSQLTVQASTKGLVKIFLILITFRFSSSFLIVMPYLFIIFPPIVSYITFI